MQPESKATQRGLHHIVLYCMALGFTTGMAMINLPPALDVLMEHYQVSYLSISILITALLWPHTFVMLPGGILVDRISLKLAATLGLFLLMTGNLTAILIPSLNAAMAGRVVCGLGTGVLFISSMKLMALHAPRAGPAPTRPCSAAVWPWEAYSPFWWCPNWPGSTGAGPMACRRLPPEPASCLILF